MDTKTLCVAIVAFMLGGLVVSIAAELEDEPESSNHGAAIVQVTR